MESVNLMTPTYDLMPADLQSQQRMQQIVEARKQHPSNFPSYWEMDEEDVALAAPEQIQNDPVERTLWAAEYGEFEVLMQMLEHHPNMLQCTDEDGYTPLHRAAYNGHTEVIQLLLNKGARVDARTEDGWTALHSASYWSQTHAAVKLLSHGADVTARTKGLQTPLHLAASNADTASILELLLLHPLSQPHLVNTVGDTPARIACRSGRFHYLFEMTETNVNHLHAN